MKIAITGGIASGKSLALDFFKRRGYFTVSADDVYADLIKKGKPLHTKLVQEFSKCILGENGEIEKPKLSALVFSNKEALNRLNALTHPAIFQEIEKLCQAHETAVVEVPVLFESGFQSAFDRIILIIASQEVRIERLKQRNAIDEKRARELICSQMQDEDKIPYCDFVIDNNKTKEKLFQKLSEVPI